MRRSAGIAALCVAAGCGGVETNKSSPTGVAGSEELLGDSSRDALGTGGDEQSDTGLAESSDNTAPASARNPACPASPPEQGADCQAFTPPNCEYGGNARHACTTIAHCTILSTPNRYQWQVTKPADGCGTNDLSCPLSYVARAEGSSCPSDRDAGSVTCDYDEGRCGCVFCGGQGGSSGGRWTCRRWDSGGNGCPPLAPLVGDACGTPLLVCNYHGCGVSVGWNVRCVAGYWDFADSPTCPAPTCDGGT
jgi:hypothetical protein